MGLTQTGGGFRYNFFMMSFQNVVVRLLSDIDRKNIIFKVTTGENTPRL